MRFTLTAVALGSALVLSALEARANFIVVQTRTQITSGPNAGMDALIFRVVNDGIGTGTKLVHVSVQIDSPQPMRFRFANLDADNVADADVAMSPGLSVKYASDPSNPRVTDPFSVTASSPNFGTAIRPRGPGENAANFIVESVVPARPTSEPIVTFDSTDPTLVTSATPTRNPAPDYANVTRFSLTGGYASAADAPTITTITTPPGGVLATIVLPRDLEVTMSGQLTGDAGAPQDFLVVPWPEPSGLALLGLGALGFIGRRGRRCGLP